MQADSEPAYMGLIQVYTRKGLFEEALAEVQKMGTISNHRTEEKLWKAYVIGAMGKIAEAEKLLEEVESRYQTENISPHNIALAKFVSGDKDSGFRWLQKAYEVHDGSLLQVAIDFELDGVRNDRRYLDLLGQIGLKP